jgi:hypothetical protein
VELEKNYKYNDGDIVTTTIAPPASGLLYHYGIVFNVEDENGILVPYVFHNTPMKENKHGGNVVLESLEDFEADGREIIDVEPSKISIRDVIEKNTRIRKNKFDWADFNCEHYISFITKGSMISIQLHRTIFITGIAIVTLLVIGAVRRCK